MSSIKNLARLTGATYLLMVPFGILGILYVPSAILVPGDMARNGVRHLCFGKKWGQTPLFCKKRGVDMQKCGQTPLFCKKRGVDIEGAGK